MLLRHVHVPHIYMKERVYAIKVVELFSVIILCRA